jgi:hypothetical protein
MAPGKSLLQGTVHMMKADQTTQRKQMQTNDMRQLELKPEKA